MSELPDGLPYDIAVLVTGGRDYTDHSCPVCGEPMATDGAGSWCSDKPHHTRPAPAPMPSLPRCEHGAAFGVAGGCTDCAMANDDGAGLTRGGAS